MGSFYNGAAYPDGGENTAGAGSYDIQTVPCRVISAQQRKRKGADRCATDAHTDPRMLSRKGAVAAAKPISRQPTVSEADRGD